MSDDDRPGRDVASRAALHRVKNAAIALLGELDELPSAARERIGATAQDADRVGFLAHRALWSSTADLNQRGEDDLTRRDVIDRARRRDTHSVAELQLITNSLQVSQHFWRAVWPDATVERWTEFTDADALEFLSITPSAGPTLKFLAATTNAAITSVNLSVTTDADAAARLREAGFEVTADGTSAVDMNATEATIHLEVP